MKTPLTTIRRPLLLILLALLICWLGIAGSASGQSQRDDVRAKLEQTDRLLDRARDVVAQMGGPKAHEMLRVGEHLQRQAWEAFHKGQLRIAEKLTEAARKNLTDLLASFRQGEDNVNEVERQLEHTDHALQDVRDRLGPNAGMGRMRRLESAVDMQRRAWDLFRQQHLRPALNMTLQAREIVLKLAGGGPGTGPGNGPGMGGESGMPFEPRFERLEEAANRVGDRVQESNDDAARDMFKRAQHALDEAREAHNAGDERRADQMLRLGREFLDRTMRQIQREVRGDQVELLISSAKDRLDLLAGPAQDSGDKRLRDWHEHAGRDLENAQSALASGHIKEALVQTRKAVSLLDKIADELGL